MTESDVELLVIPKRLPNRPPAVLLNDLGKYEEGTAWLRRGHEVLEATSRDVSFLFSPRSSQDQVDRILNYLPPSPSTIGKFVGRVDVLSRLFDWIAQNDEPRAFLWGRGGSGKSTIAHEFCQLIRDYGKSIETYDQTKFDRVVFLSAKQHELNAVSGNIDRTVYVDFTNYEESLIAILIACDYSTSENYTNFSGIELEERVRDVFDHENILIVLDDIDTLTTRGEDAGFDAIFKMSIKAKKTVRILYTQRNLPGSTESAIKVPGFMREREYYEFIESCCSQFDVPLPEPAYLDGQLKEATECIPLILETIVRLRKVCGTYGKAHAIFMERRGDEARRYLFEREYDSLPKNNNARHVLAALAEFGVPAGNDELAAVLRIGDSAVAESLGEVIGFFLSTTTSSEGETKYFLNPITRAFLKSKTLELNFGDTILERVRAFKSSGQKKPKEVVIIEGEAERLISRGALDEARELVSRAYPPKILENPAFRMLRGTVYARSNRPLFAEAKDDFHYCSDHGYEDADGMRAWLVLERESGSYLGQVKVADLVINGRSYAENFRHEFIARKAVATFFKARDSAYSDAFDLLADALKGHVKAFNYFWNRGTDAHWNFKSVRNTGFALVSCSKQVDFDKQLVKVFRDIQRSEGRLCEPLLDPIYQAARFLAEQRGGDVGKRREALLIGLLRDLQSGTLCFESAEATARCATRISELIENSTRRAR